MREFKTKHLFACNLRSGIDALRRLLFPIKSDGVLPDLFGRDALYDRLLYLAIKSKFERLLIFIWQMRKSISAQFDPPLSRTTDEAHLVIFVRGRFEMQARLPPLHLTLNSKWLATNNQMH